MEVLEIVEGESEGDYLQRWPVQFSNFPSCVVRNWCYRHNREVIELWQTLLSEKTQFRAVRFTVEEVMLIRNTNDRLEEDEAWGDWQIRAGERASFVAKYMLEHGRFPAPVIVAKDAAVYANPYSHNGEKMRTPLQLIEGHCRIGVFRAMRKAGLELASCHDVWEVKFVK